MYNQFKLEPSWIKLCAYNLGYSSTLKHVIFSDKQMKATSLFQIGMIESIDA